MKKVLGVILAVSMLLPAICIFSTTSYAVEEYELIGLRFTDSAGNDIAEIADGMKVFTKIKNNSGSEKKVGIRVIAYKANGDALSLTKSTTKNNAKTIGDGVTSDELSLTLGAVKTNNAASLKVYVITYSGASASLASGALYEFKSNPNYLTSISVDGNAIADYSDSVNEYSVLCNNEHPIILVEKGNETQTVSIDESGLPNSAVITVTAESGDSRTITLNFINDSTSLSYLKVNGKAIENFSDGQNSYSVLVDTPYPYIEIGKGSNTQAVEYEKKRLPAEIRVTVTAQSGRERVINLKIATTQSLGEYRVNDNMLLWVSSANNTGENITDTDATKWKDLSGSGNDFKISGKWTESGLKIKAKGTKNDANILPDGVKKCLNGSAFTVKFKISDLNTLPNSDLPIMSTQNGLLRLYVPKNSDKIYLRWSGAKFTPLMANVAISEALDKENAITVDSDYIRWYIDGVLRTSMPVYDIKGGSKNADKFTLSDNDALSGGAVVFEEIKVFDKALSLSELNANDVINSDPTLDAWYNKVNACINVCRRISNGEDSYTVLSQDDNMSLFYDSYTSFHSANSNEIAREMSGYFSASDISADYASYAKLADYAQKALRFVKTNKGTELTETEFLTVIEETGDSAISALADKISDDGMAVAAALLATKKSSNYATYINDVKTELVLAAISYPKNYDWTDVAKTITDYSAYLGIDVSDFNRLSEKSRANIAKEISESKPTDANDIINVIKKYAVVPQEPIAATSGGGGGISVVTPTPIVNSVPAGTTVAGFSDMKGSEWVEDALSYMVKKGFISGVSETEFAPKRNITRGEFVAIITRCEVFDTDGEYEAIFDDVDEDFWGYKNIIAAYKNGIISGVDERLFDPNGEITRQDMAVVLYNAYIKQMPVEETDVDFSDWEYISGYAREAVGKLHALKILNGYDGEFLPKGLCTRAEAVQAIYGYQKALNRD